tara:strand:+ start:476 stop:670 length:195 start_codon:yes stop_codon:yes gene_type:complete
MRTRPVATYVIFDPKNYKLIECAVDPNFKVKPELVDRVRKYIAARQPTPAPTGGEESDRCQVDQ